MLLGEFKKHFGDDSKRVKNYFAPGRVNLIGEHIDYNGGKVLPFALSQGISATVRFNFDSRCIRIASTQATTVLEIDLDSENKFERRADDWQNYPLGVLYHLSEKLHLPLVGADIMLESTLPARSGLSSSAAIEVLTAFIFLHRAKHQLATQRIALAKLCQQVENEFIGVQCGIMDQFAIAVSRKNYATLLQCDKCDYEYIPLELQDVNIVVMNTNKERTLTHSKYNERRSECEEVLKVVRQHKELRNLSEITVADINALSDTLLKRRARHVFSENMRVSQTVQALKDNNWHRIGLLMNASHKSLQKDYEVTGYELDTLTKVARSHAACFGARMTGAGFGGCAIALVEKTRIDSFIDHSQKYYLSETGLPLDIYVSSAEEGVRVM